MQCREQRKNLRVLCRGEVDAGEKRSPGRGVRHDDAVEVLVKVVARRRVHEETVGHESSGAPPVVGVSGRHELQRKAMPPLMVGDRQIRCRQWQRHPAQNCFMNRRGMRHPPRYPLDRLRCVV